MTIANAAILIGLAGFAATVTAPHPSKPEALVSTDEEASSCCDCGSEYFLPVFYPTSCFDLTDLGDRDECLRVELEDQAIAYSTGVENYHRPIRIRRLPEPVHWKTLPPPFVCHVLL